MKSVFILIKHIHVPNTFTKKKEEKTFTREMEEPRYYPKNTLKSSNW
jgi:hypothetical protein